MVKQFMDNPLVMLLLRQIEWSFGKFGNKSNEFSKGTFNMYIIEGVCYGKKTL